MGLIKFEYYCVNMHSNVLLEPVIIYFSDEQYDKIVSGSKTADCVPGFGQFVELRYCLSNQNMIIHANDTKNNMCMLKIIAFHESKDINTALEWIANQHSLGGIHQLALNTNDLKSCRDELYQIWKDKTQKYRGYGFFFKLSSDE